MKARTLAIVIAVLLIVPLVLFACGAPEPTPTPAPLPTQAPTQAPAKAAPGAALAQSPSATQAPTASPELTMPRVVAATYAAGTRSPDGRPGPNYWQNSSVHDIQLTVTPPDRIIHGTETITYTNNSPRELAYVPVRLYQNAHRPTAPREDARPPER